MTRMQQPCGLKAIKCIFFHRVLSSKYPCNFESSSPPVHLGHRPAGQAQRQEAPRPHHGPAPYPASEGGERTPHQYSPRPHHPHGRPHPQLGCPRPQHSPRPHGCSSGLALSQILPTTFSMPFDVCTF